MTIQKKWPNAAVGLACSLVIIGLVYLYFGSFDQMTARIQGQTHTIRPSRFTAQVDRSRSTIFPVVFQIENLTSRPIRVLGAELGCRCSVPLNLPCTVEPGSISELIIEVDTRIAPETLTENANFFVQGLNGIEITSTSIGLVLTGDFAN